MFLFVHLFKKKKCLINYSMKEASLCFSLLNIKCKKYSVAFCFVIFIETTKYTDMIRLLEEEINALKATKSTYDKDMQSLKEKLSESKVENEKSEKIIHDQCETISTLENGKNMK